MLESFLGAWHCFRHNGRFASNNKGRLSVQRKSWLDYFATGLVNSVLARRVSEVLGEFKVQKNCYQSCSSKYVFRASWNDSWVSTCYLQLARMTSCKTDFLCTLPANRKTNKWKPTTTKKGLEHSFSVRFYTKAPKKRQPLKVYLNYRNFLHSMLLPEFPKFSGECSLSKFSSFWRNFLRKLCLENLVLFVHISKFPIMLKDWKAASVFSRLELLKCFFRAWNCFNVS